jgi:subtilase family serine protease
MIDRFRWMTRRLTGLAVGPLLAVGVAVTVPPAPLNGPILVPLAIQAPRTTTTLPGAPAACSFPDNSPPDPFFHCYTPGQIAAAYGIDQVHTGGNLGEGQTIVLVDAYGSPTAASDLQHFHDTFFKKLRNPNFDQVFPFGAPDFNNVANGSGLSGSGAAALWAGEATLDIEWSYATAPLAHIVLLAVPPAETEGVQGFPNIFKAEQDAIDAYPAGTIFSQSFGVTEQTFGGAAAAQTAAFDEVYKHAAARGDTVFASAGDFGTTNSSKLHREAVAYNFPTVIWPTSSPWVTSAGGTQLQFGWTWSPTSNVPFDAKGNPTPGYFNWVSGGNSETVWNESWAPIATGGGPSSIYGAQSFQAAQQGVIGGSARGVPDLAWNAAVNGGVLVFMTAFPNVNGQGWFIFGGTSAASPQLAGVIALANAARAGMGKGPIGYLNPVLYRLGDMAGSSTAAFNGSGDFRDIVPQQYGTMPVGFLHDNTLWQFHSDGSVSSGPIHGWPTRPGWDMTTGFGTPRVAKFIADLASF